MNYSTKIREYRTKNNLSQEKLSEIIGCAKNTVSRYERGDLPKTNSTAWVALLKLLETMPEGE